MQVKFVSIASIFSIVLLAKQTNAGVLDILKSATSTGNGKTSPTAKPISVPKPTINLPTSIPIVKQGL
ncbi:hypothetical protein K7432_017892 [Basidiobolus ranarum]|uniref:Uncharacterized protein n=1 Tax=Basidiobolus ranarum TaxID=34480 RepID=A0ABR2VJT1_9FUNG